jgi:uncharacterized membrane protein
MNNHKCANCGLVNFASAAECRRCAAPLGMTWAAAAGDASVVFDPDTVEESGLEEEKPRRSLLRRAAAVLCMTLALLVGLHASLLWTSEAATMEQRIKVRRAVDLIEQSGFGREAFLLKHATNFRTSDNWWNAYMGHGEAYAATNFPFEVVTLYPEFFQYPTDDVERAVILLHEARHLSGAGEEEAFAGVWRDKARLGWTREKYGQTRVWKNVGEFTRRYAPKLFACGQDGRQDCYE